MLNAVQRNGPMVLEIGKCNHCGMEWFAFHAFQESLPCGACGKRNASQAPIYKPDANG